MSTLMSTREKIIEIIVQHLSLQPNKIGDDATLDSLGMDSLDRVELVMRIEEELDVEISDDKADSICKVSELVDYVDSLKQ